VTVATSPLLGDPAPPGHRWVTDLSVGSFPHLADHRLQGMIVLPGSAYLEMALAAATAVTGRTPSTVDTMAFERAFIVAPSGARRLQVELRSSGAARREAGQWEFVATGAATGVRHASARLPAGPGEPASSLADRLRPADPRWWQGTELPGEALYRRLHAVGNDFGPAFRGVQRCVVGDGQAAGTMLAPAAGDRELAGYLLHPVVLDTAMQVLTAASGVADRTFALVGFDRLRLLCPPGAAGRVYARLRPDQPAADLRVGDVLLVDHAGRPAVELTGVRLRCLPMPHQVTGAASPPALTIAVAATFTAEPLTDALSFWFDTLGVPATIEYADVNQPFQQLLDPGSLLSTNASGANVILVRPDDLCPGAGPPGPSATAEPPGDRPRFVVPGVGEIAHLIGYETESLYDEIFARQAYLRHGIELRDGDCVFDVGANIGLFTLFVHSRCADARVFAFEPSPPAYDVLRRNVAAHCPGTRVFDYGLSDGNGTRPFTFYRTSTVFSGFAADPARDRVAVEAVVRNAVRTTLPQGSPDLEPLVEELTRGRLDAEVYPRQTRTLSSVITEHGVRRIDLLKIDTEGSEADILAGVAEQHWPLIRQVVVEVHDAARGRRLRELLARHGFQVVLDDTDETLRGTGFAHVFARRPEQAERAGRAEPSTSRRTWLAQAERNAEDLVRAIEVSRRLTGVPYIVVVCPDSAAGLDRVAQRLAEGLADLPGVVVLTADAIQRAYPVAGYADLRAQRLGGIPYTGRFFTAIGTMIARTYLAYRQPPVTVLALDCDQTLWAGVCGEDGPAGVVVDAPRRALQEFAVRQHDAGTLLCLCSRNNPDDVLEVFARRTDMPLGLGHVVARRLSWRAKSASLASLAEELGLGLDGFVLLDDDPVECAEVRSGCPEVLTLRLPAAAEEIPHFLHHIWAFDRVRVTDEDRARTDRYRQESQRRAARDPSMTFESFLASLDLRVAIGPGTRADLPRVAQLTQRTNQFTATATRHTEAELAELLGSGALGCRTVRVEDRFGDYGLVGAMLFRADAGVLRVDTFLLSCRALGRGVEHRMLAELGQIARGAGLERIEVPLVPTGRNEPAREFLQAVAEVSPGAGAGLLCTVPAETAARLVFDPAARAGRATPAALPPGTRPAPRTRLPTSVYRRIAEELHDLDAIVEAVEASRVRRRPGLRNAFAGPGDEIERSLVSLWQRVLGIDEVGVDDNFFELGGTSLRAVQVMAELSDRTGAAVRTVSLFERSTIRAVAALLRADAAGPDSTGPDSTGTDSTGTDSTGTAGQRRGRRRRELRRAVGRPAPRSGGHDGA
jgi:FkbH-like protein/FkbM family methyltransferase